MERPFHDFHATAGGQLGLSPETVPDTDEILSLRSAEPSLSNLLKLGKALSFSLRYREAIEVYLQALEYDPDSPEAHRLLAGRYLTTLQSDMALSEFTWCLEHGGDAVDCRYRMGLSLYFKGSFTGAMDEFEAIVDEADSEMKAAIIYWHSLSAIRQGCTLSLLSFIPSRDEVSHHRAYYDGLLFFRGEITASSLRAMTEREECDMEYSIRMYALAVYFNDRNILKNIAGRGEYWFCFSSLAAWNDLSELKLIDEPC